MTGRIFRAIVAVSAVVLLGGMGFLMAVLYGHFNQQVDKELKREAYYLSVLMEEGGQAALEELDGQEERVTLVAADGTVLFDNRADSSTMDNHAQREEISEAMLTGVGRSVRASDTMGRQTIYYAVRLNSGDILRVSSTQYTPLMLVLGLVRPALVIVLVILILGGVFANRVSKHIVAPINAMDLEHLDDGDVYQELSPLVTKVRRQQRTIRRQMEEALRRKEEFDLIADHMSEGLILIDGRLEVLTCNRSARAMLDAAVQAEGDTVLALERGPAFQAVVEQAVAGQRAEMLLERDERSYRLTASPVHGEGGPAGAVLLLVDVTENLQREQLRREFTANVSHEMKTPLTSISGFAEILRDGMVQPADQAKFAGRIFDEAQRLIRLVEDIIKISQLDEGELNYQRERVDLAALCGEVLARLEGAAAPRNITLRLEGEGTLTTVRPILEEVITNLCDNAVKYNKDGGTVTVKCTQENGRTALSVSDTGIGIPEAHRTRVFERFYRVDKSRSKAAGGTGLGLSIVKHGAAYLGAALRLDSAEGMGTTVTLEWKE